MFFTTPLSVLLFLCFELVRGMLLFFLLFAFCCSLPFRFANRLTQAVKGRLLVVPKYSVLVCLKGQVALRRRIAWRLGTKQIRYVPCGLGATSALAISLSLLAGSLVRSSWALALLYGSKLAANTYQETACLQPVADVQRHNRATLSLFRAAAA